MLSVFLEWRKVALQEEVDDLALRKRTVQPQLGHISPKNVKKWESHL